MPTYEYACDACRHHFEKEQRITEDPIKKCPKCGKAKARRMISRGNFILKGGGWYADLYHKPSGKKPVGDSDTSSSESTKSADGASASSDAKSDAKPDTKSESKSEKKPEPKPEKKTKKKAAT